MLEIKEVQKITIRVEEFNIFLLVVEKHVGKWQA